MFITRPPENVIEAGNENHFYIRLRDDYNNIITAKDYPSARDNIIIDVVNKPNDNSNNNGKFNLNKSNTNMQQVILSEVAPVDEKDIDNNNNAGEWIGSFVITQTGYYTVSIFYSMDKPLQNMNNNNNDTGANKRLTAPRGKELLPIGIPIEVEVIPGGKYPNHRYYISISPLNRE